MDLLLVTLTRIKYLKFKHTYYLCFGGLVVWGVASQLVLFSIRNCWPALESGQTFFLSFIFKRKFYKVDNL